MNFLFFNNYNDILKDFFERYNIYFSIILTSLISFIIAYITTPNYLFLIFTFFFFILLIALFLYYIFIPIRLSKTDFGINFPNQSNPVYFNIPFLIIDEYITLKLSIKLELTRTFKNNIKNGSYYTIIIEKDKSIEVSSIPEYVKDNDLEDKRRNNYYYYLVQEYSGQNELDFEFLFSCSDKINLNKKCIIYILYGDVHEKIINQEYNEVSFKNKFFEDEFFITNFDTIC